ncbi:MAG: hypothetical protein M1829_006289 [Trizodia sp. TS-e1964]|nr:MAG: hypothetical protein M1829_006289 [Trizodia sp. TS-e1964]
MSYPPPGQNGFQFLNVKMPQIYMDDLFVVQALLTCGALAWLLHRSYLILIKPVPELINVLGLEMPYAPEVSLSSIKSDTVTLHWPKAKRQVAGVTNIVQVNGDKVGQYTIYDTTIKITGLTPDTFYNVRVVAANANFHAHGRLIRLKTLKRSGPINGSAAIESCALGEEQIKSNGPNSPSSIQVHLEPAPPSPASTALTKELGGNLTHRGRLSLGRRNSPAKDHVTGSDAPSTGASQSNAEQLDSEQTIRQLTETLESIQCETTDLQKTMAKEEEEFEASKTDLIKEREQIKQAIKEKDDASAEIRKENSLLERSNRVAQSKKAAKEKVLQQKEIERNKMLQELERWSKENAEIDAELKRMEKEKKRLSDSTEKKIAEVKVEMRRRQNSIKLIEEEIRTRGVQIKELEEARKKLKGGNDAEGNEHDRLERAKDLQWEQKEHMLQIRYTSAFSSLQQAQANLSQAQEQLNWWNARRLSNPSQFAGLPPPEPVDQSAKKGMPRKTRQRKSRTNTLSSSVGSYAASELVFASPSLGHASPIGVSPSLVPATPLYNISNGMSHHTALAPLMDQADFDITAGAAPLSPTANALLPSNLLGDEDFLGSIDRPYSSHAHFSHPFGGNAFPFLGSTKFDAIGQPQSPTSSGSRSASVFSSPQTSLNNLPRYHNGADDSDRRSLHSIGASFGPIGPANGDSNPSNSKKLANLFSFNRQRGKTLPNELPALGSLKSSQSSSFPREPETEDLDPIGTKRRRGSHSGSSWVPNLPAFLNRSSAIGTEGNGPAPARNPARKPRHFNMFSAKYDPIDPSAFLASNSRPSSVYSDNSLPRPSSDSQPFGWPTAGESILRSSPLGADWSGPHGPWSRSSRRQSVHLNSPSSLSLGMAPIEGEVLSHMVRQTSQPDPIGTRPSKKTTSAPKLNPAAPTFKHIFSRGDTKKGEKAAEKAAAAAAVAATREAERTIDSFDETDLSESSPSRKRNSRDTRSIHTLASLADSHDSFDRSTISTTSEHPPSSTATDKGRESLTQKIMRKTSSSKFNLSAPWKEKFGVGKREKGEITPGELSTAEGSDMAERAGSNGSGSLIMRGREGSLSSSPNLNGASGSQNGSIGLEAKVSQRSGINWSFGKSRKQRKGEKATATSSETGDDDEE